MLSVLDFKKKKEAQEPITMVTCYDYTSAVILSKTDIDCILVGDSLAMTMHGFKDTISATINMMSLHTAAVSRGASNKFIIGDLPFLSYRKSLTENMNAAEALMQSGAHALKLEGVNGNTEFISHLVNSGIPVMGHIGLTPQFVNQLGGYKVQGKTEEAAKRLMDEAKELENAGCFAVVLECVPNNVSAAITKQLSIPTIGIGAGNVTNGQVLVFQDMLGLNTEFKPKFVKKFINGADIISDAINEYCMEVKNGTFPNNEQSYN